jgi:hypothetical protein
VIKLLNTTTDEVNMNTQTIIKETLKRLQTEQVAISLSKVQWAQILGLLEALEGADIRRDAAQELMKEIQKALSK